MIYPQSIIFAHDEINRKLFVMVSSLNCFSIQDMPLRIEIETTEEDGGGDTHVSFYQNNLFKKIYVPSPYAQSQWPNLKDYILIVCESEQEYFKYKF